jgi:chromosome segregation ATPase
MDAEVDYGALAQQWVAVDLDGVREQLDDAAGTILDFREECQSTRVETVKRTKALKEKADSADMPESFKQSWPKLLVGYRNEINGLSQRAKFAETSFLDLYQKLRAVPCPSTALKQAARAAQDQPGLDHSIKVVEAEKEDLQKQLEQQQELLVQEQAASKAEDSTAVQRLQEQLVRLHNELEEERVAKEQLQQMHVDAEQEEKHQLAMRQEQQQRPQHGGAVLEEALRERGRLEELLSESEEKLRSSAKLVGQLQAALETLQREKDEMGGGHAGSAEEAARTVKELASARVRVAALESESQDYAESKREVVMLKSMLGHSDGRDAEGGSGEGQSGETGEGRSAAGGISGSGFFHQKIKTLQTEVVRSCPCFLLVFFIFSGPLRDSPT